MNRLYKFLERNDFVIWLVLLVLVAYVHERYERRQTTGLRDYVNTKLAGR